MASSRTNKIVYTYGVYDLFHLGHIKSLKQARALGGRLIVGVFTDRVAEGFKRKPIIDQKTRLETIRASGLADEAVLQDEFYPEKNIKRFKPDIVAKGQGAGWEKGEIPKFKGAKSVFLKYTKGISTSLIINKIKNDNLKQCGGEVSA